MKVISLNEAPKKLEMILRYISDAWGNENTLPMYRDCLIHSVDSPVGLPQWYALIDNERIVGCAGLITNDFISRMDLFPWLSSLFIDEEYRGRGYSRMLVKRAMQDTKKLGYSTLQLCTELTGYYENMGFTYIGQGFHPWGEESRIYQIKIK